MAHHDHLTKTNAVPLKDIARVLEALWDAELRDFASNPSPDHLFRHLAAVANWLNAGSDWAAVQYVESRNVLPDSGWDAARILQKDEPPRYPKSANDPDPDWKYLGIGSRYRITRPGESLVTIVGWDRPLDTFFAQVWDVPEGVTFHEHGQLMFWCGYDFNQINSVDELELLLERYTRIPEALGLDLEKDRLGFGLAFRG